MNHQPQHSEMRDFLRDTIAIGSTLTTRDADECLRDHETALLADFLDRCAVVLSGCCDECDIAIKVIQSRLTATLDGTALLERMNLRWSEQVDTPRDPAADTVVHCTDANGRPYALALTTDQRAVLGDMLLNPPDAGEVAAENGDSDPVGEGAR
ncbi:hypothetical protein [Streptomyces sp. NPDC001205]